MVRPDSSDARAVTITRARYGGIYEPGEWLPFPLLPSELPIDWDADDVTCRTFWETRHDVGGGHTPRRGLLRPAPPPHPRPHGTHAASPDRHAITCL